MASPLLVVLNTENFEELREARGGGGLKDFFAFQDVEFEIHKENLISQIDSVIKILESQPQGPIGYLKVTLRRDAWAKSHRPVRSLFKKELTPLVGGADIGEMIFEVQPDRLEKVKNAIIEAETTTRIRERDKTPAPTSRKSETGAISSISLFGKIDKRSFSVRDGIKWLSNPSSGGGYEVELFDKLCAEDEWENLDAPHRILHKSFIEGFSENIRGVEVAAIPCLFQESSVLKVRLNSLIDDPPIIRLQDYSSRDRQVPAPFENNEDKHLKLLKFLENHPFVRRIELPALISHPDGPDSEIPANSSPIKLPIRQSNKNYPTVGVIDGGISDFLKNWVIGSWDILDDGDTELSHGTFIGGLLIAGSTLNGQDNCPEVDGIDVIDLALMPDEGKNLFGTYYPGGADDFLMEIDAAVSEVAEKFGVRIFNLSLNFAEQTALNSYSKIAAKFDEIAEKYNIIFIMSAGNLLPQNFRTEWPMDDSDALLVLASSIDDRIKIPAESARNVSVSALNPSGTGGCIDFAPACYSRRGPGLRAGVKPDFAQVGGCGSTANSNLYSIHPSGLKVNDCGTSYAAPLVAKTASIIDHLIEGEVSRETLMGLLYHHAKIPDVLKTKKLKQIARHLVGFGIPPVANEVLETEDHEITLVFRHFIKSEQQIEFKFNWPPSLVENGKCKGYAKLSLVSTPPIDRRFGAEFIRVNVDARLQQLNSSGQWNSRLDSVCNFSDFREPSFEYHKIKHSMKWSAVKMYERSMPRGVGESSEWRLFVNYLTRLDVEFPEEGIPFTVFLTIGDIDEVKPVFSEVQQNLLASGVKLEDIKVASKVAHRV